MLDHLRSRAPRLRLGALIAVGVIVIGLVTYAATRPDVTARGSIGPSGNVCVSDGDRIWTGQDADAPPEGAAIAIEGTLRPTGPNNAVLTTSTGRTIELRTDQVEGEWRNGMVACAIYAP